MKKALILSIVLLLIICNSISAQEGNKYNYSNKGKLYFYWGWNASRYSKSDISFHGKNYDFTLSDVKAYDRQTSLTLDYINPDVITIPQYNARIGYFISDKYSISIGNDHMKYVMRNGQTVGIDGIIKNSNTTYDAYYDNDKVKIAFEFLKFEHTDGLNYENIDFRRHERLKQMGQFTLDYFAGVGFGIMLPKTNVTFLGGQRYDEFNIAGYGINLLAGANLTFRGRYFIQTELKGGYADLPNIRVSKDESEGASQHFNFIQYNILVGAYINLKKKTN
jgi:hypothetical protein